MTTCKDKPASGKCYLIGAGPGAADLITVRGLNCLQRCEEVYYDHLAAPELLTQTKESARLLAVGKRAGKHTCPQEEICQLLVDAVKAGKQVARLKGGDPLIFGRGGEEAQTLAAAGLAYEIIPGVTAAAAAGAFGGIPLTHRGLSSAVTLVTGHEMAGSSPAPVNWPALARSGATLAIYMGVGHLAEITAQLLAGGRAPSEPAALVENAGTTAQRVVAGELANIAAQAAAQAVKPPAILLVGASVTLRSELDWLGRLPLYGQRIIITRARPQAGKLSNILRDWGAEAVEIPALKISPVAQKFSPVVAAITQNDAAWPAWEELSPALAACDSLTQGVLQLRHPAGGAVVFTSANGAKAAGERLRALGLDARLFGRWQIFSIGPGTAAALSEFGLRADHIPHEHTSQALAAEILAQSKDAPVLLLRAENATNELPDILQAAGRVVANYTAYQVRPAPLANAHAALLACGDFAAATFASAQTAQNFADFAGNNLANLLAKKDRPGFISIGPVTSKKMRQLQIPVDAQAAQATVPDLACATRQWLQAQAKD